MHGDGYLIPSKSWTDGRGKSDHQKGALFASLRDAGTDCCRAALKRTKEFVRTGIDLVDSPHWDIEAAAIPLETQRPGGSPPEPCVQGSQRVASAVGEGSCRFSLYMRF